MKRTKQQKGITLIALIITIVVLLILAVVTIRAVQGDGIVQYAQNARDNYDKAQTDEQTQLQNYLDILKNETGNSEVTSATKWTQEGATLTRINADGTKTEIKIGDYVNYNEGSYTHTPDTAKGAGTSKTGGSSSEGYTLGTNELTTEDLKWRVLGINEKGELELISADLTTQELYLANDEGYVNAVTTYNEDGSVKELGTLDAFCNDLYGQGTNAEGKKVATRARSLNVDDINKLTKYDPKTYSGYDDETGDEYGNKWTYKYPTDEEVNASTTGLTKNMWYKTEKPDGTLVTDWTNITYSGYQTFRLPNEETAISSSNLGSKEVTSSYYAYNIPSELTVDDGFTEDEATAISNMITKGTGSSSLRDYWIASNNVYCYSYVSFNVHVFMSKGVESFGLFSSYEGFYYDDCFVRPVVSLSSNISLTGSGENVGSSTNMWEIS